MTLGEVRSYACSKLTMVVLRSRFLSSAYAEQGQVSYSTQLLRMKRTDHRHYLKTGFLEDGHYRIQGPVKAFLTKLKLSVVKVNVWRFFHFTHDCYFSYYRYCRPDRLNDSITLRFEKLL